MSKEVTYEAFVESFGGIEEVKDVGGFSVQAVFALLDHDNFSKDRSQRRALLRELLKHGYLDLSEEEKPVVHKKEVVDDKEYPAYFIPLGENWKKEFGY